MSLDITPLVTDDRLMISSYGDGAFTVNDHKVQGSVLLFDGKVEPWAVTEVADITLETIQPLLEAQEEYDILLIGIGERSKAPPKDIKLAAKEKGMVLEWMNSSGAVRTFSVLQTEDRRVCAAIIAV